MHRKIIMTCAAIAAFAAFATPSASAANLKGGGVTIAVGSSITGVNVGNILFTAGNLTVTCSTAHVAGMVITDVGGTILVEVPPYTSHFTGTGNGGDCTSPLGDVTPTVTSRLCLHLSAGADVGTVTGCSGSGSVKFSLNITGVATCKYTAASVSSTIITTGDAESVISEAPATEEGGLFLCPDTDKLDMRFVWSTTSGPTLQFTS